VILLLVALGIPPEKILKKQKEHMDLIVDTQTQEKLMKRFRNME
jgi:hypothetical protein